MDSDNQKPKVLERIHHPLCLTKNLPVDKCMLAAKMFLA
jgi:hypothetical protein